MSCCQIKDILNKQPVAIWPQEVRNDVQPKWNLYVKWTQERGSKVNRVIPCIEHNVYLVNLWQNSSYQDVIEQEATERWLTLQNSRMIS